MNKELLKKLLRDQFEPMSVAVSEKLAYLQSDDVFTDKSAAVYGMEDSQQPDEDEMISKAFAFSEKVNELSANPVEPTIMPAKPVENSEPAAPMSENSKHRLIAEKIAALRGISIDSDYYKRK